jgi:DNA-binding NarL/FixJ family response regulator
MLTAYRDERSQFAAIMAGASGYLVKQVKTVELVDDIRLVAGGESLIDPKLAQQVALGVQAEPAEDPLLTTLTPQERKILDLVANGLTNRQIAAELYLAEKTVKNYMSNLLAKLGMQRRTQAVKYATRIADQQEWARTIDAAGT